MFGVIANTFTELVIFTSANALPENTPLRTLNPEVVSGAEITPLAIPAFNFAATLLAIDLPVYVFEITNTLELSLLAISATTLA